MQKLICYIMFFQSIFFSKIVPFIFAGASGPFECLECLIPWSPSTGTEILSEDGLCLWFLSGCFGPLIDNFT